MPGYDWVLLADRDGDAIESLLATLLIHRHRAARQVNPSQGDGGIDILLSRPEGLEVWQVKKFTSPLSSGQWTQVKDSWARFNREHVDKGDAIYLYHLVTPWTPTRERYDDFEDLTAGASFPVQWDGEAYINGLADEFPATMERFVHGPDVLERFVLAKSVLAQSPVESGSEQTMLDGVNIRQQALDEIRDTISDGYRIEQSTRTTGSDAPPMPMPGDPAVYHRMTYLGENRWRTESIVPRDSTAESDPLSLEITFLAKDDSPEQAAITRWQDWGTPFTDVPATTVIHGGPYDGETHEDALLSFVGATTAGEHPDLFFVVRDEDDATRFKLPLSVLSRTRGVKTGWLLLEAETPMRSLRFELRVKSQTDASLDVELGNVDGLDPELVLQELTGLAGIQASDSFAIEVRGNVRVVGGHRVTPPEMLERFYLPTARILTMLQQHTSAVVEMPDVQQMTLQEFEDLERLEALYGGTPEVSTWSSRSLVLNSDRPVDQQQLSAIRNATVAPMILTQPLLTLAGRVIKIDHPLFTRLHSWKLDESVDLTELRPGDTVMLVPNDDDQMTTAPVSEWSPGSMPALDTGS